MSHVFTIIEQHKEAAVRNVFQMTEFEIYKHYGYTVTLGELKDIKEGKDLIIANTTTKKATITSYEA